MFYRAVEQAVLLFGSETWVLLASMERKVEGTHTCFLQNITGEKCGGELMGHGMWPGSK